MSKDLPRSMFTKNYPRKAFKSLKFCFTPLLELIEKLCFWGLNAVNSMKCCCVLYRISTESFPIRVWFLGCIPNLADPKHLQKTQRGENQSMFSLCEDEVKKAGLMQLIPDMYALKTKTRVAATRKLNWRQEAKLLVPSYRGTYETPAWC